MEFYPNLVGIRNSILIQKIMKHKVSEKITNNEIKQWLMENPDLIRLKELSPEKWKNAITTLYQEVF